MKERREWGEVGRFVEGSGDEDYPWLVGEEERDGVQAGKRKNTSVEMDVNGMEMCVRRVWGWC